MKFKLRIVCSLLVSFVVLCNIPAWWFSRYADVWSGAFHPDQLKLTNAVIRQVSAPLSRSSFRTGDSQFDGEWLFGTYLMAGFGLCQMAAINPEMKEDWKQVITQCVRNILSPQVRAFDDESWGRSALDTLEYNDGHAAYLGYLNLLLSLFERVYGPHEFSDLNTELTECLFRRLNCSRTGLVATYPDEWYPVDNAALASSVILYAKNRNQITMQRKMDGWIHRFKEKYIDSENGLLIQAINRKGNPMDAPR
ncbi:MAG: hypothetical protein AAF558_14235, partial [Verrucomicrobiota bacterium]